MAGEKKILGRMVQIIEETPGKETGGHFGTESVAFPAAATSTTVKDVTPHVPIALLAAQIQCKGLTDGDKLIVEIGPETPVGAITADVAIAQKTIEVPQSVIDLFVDGTLFIGMKLLLSDGTNDHDDCGTITAYDDQALTVTVTNGPANAFLAATPTTIEVTACMTPNILGGGHVELRGADHAILSVGEEKIGGSRVEAGQPIRIKYVNTGPTVQVACIFSYLY